MMMMAWATTMTTGWVWEWAIKSQMLPQSILRYPEKIAPAGAVFLGGINLILIQWVLVRELSALLLGTELVVLLVSAAYFIGISVGYLAAPWIRRRWLIPLAIFTLVMHLSLPVWMRIIVVFFDLAGAFPWIFIILPLLAIFIVPAFYSIFLPFFADGGSLPRFYALELSGAVFGVLVLVLAGGMGLPAVGLIYALALLGILWLLGSRPALILFLALISAIWLLILPEANRWSNALWYQSVRGLPEGTRTLVSAYSPYQKVDVLESPDGARFLYLDGLEHFGSNDGSRLNVIMGRIPASLVQPKDALVIGAGSMEMERMIAQSSGAKVTTVELDPLVIDVSLEHFLAFNQMDSLPGRSLIVDDAKHYLANTDTSYDLIATDTPAAFSIQTATLYSEDFFRTMKARLKPGGIVVINLTSTFEPGDVVSRRIAAGLLAVFDDIVVLTSGTAGWSFAYAGEKLPFDRSSIESALRAEGETQYVLFSAEAVRTIARDAQPITLDSMDIVLQISADWVADRLNR